jgi:hypothetical protein
MKKLNRFCAGAILMLAFTVSAFAGQMNCPGVVDPPPPPEATGQISCPALVEAAVSLIQSILALP